MSRKLFAHLPPWLQLEPNPVDPEDKDRTLHTFEGVLVSII